MNRMQLPIAAIHFGDGDPIDDLLEQAAIRLGESGYTVEGFLQREVPANSNCCSTTLLESIQDLSHTKISQDLGPQSRGCRLDPQAFAELVQPLIHRLWQGADLLIINRFGKGESQGAGFRTAITCACEMGIPVLTAVRKPYLEAWQEYTGGRYSALPPDDQAVMEWTHHVCILGGNKERLASFEGQFACPA